MPYRFLDDVATADIAFEATGNNLDELFRAAADATLAVMLEDARELLHRDTRTVSLSAADLQDLLFRFLQEIIYFKDADCLLLQARDVQVEQQGSLWQLDAMLTGEAVDIGRHHVNVDIKAVTYHRFDLKRTKEGYTATVVLDI